MNDEFVIPFEYTQKQHDIIYGDCDAKFVIITKGRRAGITKGYEQGFIEWAIDGVSPMLWVDTVNGNIDRYFERYFYPDLKKIEGKIDWDWNGQKKILKIGEALIDFRSAERRENIEGFGYKKIFLNEAGIILEDDSLYTLSILPMLMDFGDSQLIAAGVPKGKFKKDGNKHKFFELYELAVSGNPRYQHYHLTGYDNTFINPHEIDEMRKDMTDVEASQEILGEFVEFTGKNPFAHQYDPAKHESDDAVFDPSKQIIISVDFNLNPFAVTFTHIWQDAKGFHEHTFDEMSINNGSIPAMVDAIFKRYGRWIQSALLTGDAMGKKGDISQQDNASLYMQLMRGFGMSESQLRVRGNPTHENSRADVNYLLAHYHDWKINPLTCPETCRDFKNVQCDAFGQIIKKNRNDLNQRADFLDTKRYVCENFQKEWIHKHQKGYIR